MTSETGRLATTKPVSRRREPLVPGQHGAWAFLVLPVVLGGLAGGWSPYLLAVVATWIALYPFSWALTNRLTARRAQRFDRPLLFWGLVIVPLVLVSTVLVPWLVWVGIAYLAPFAGNLGFAYARRERSLSNDLVLIVECVAAVPVVAGVASGRQGGVPPWSAMATDRVALMALVCLLALVGSTLHVKSLIRERNNPAFTRASQVVAVVSVPVVAASSVLLSHDLLVALPFVLLALRALFWHDPSWRPSRIGVVELVCLVAVAAGAAATLS